jgi:hypothetical protein
MKIETNSGSAVTHIPGTDNSAKSGSSTPLLDNRAVLKGGNVNAAPDSGNNGAPNIPPPDKTTSVDSLSFGEDKMVNIPQLLMWIATMAAEYIKQQNELNNSLQKANEQGFKASMQAAEKNYSKNLTQAIVGIVGSAISLAGSAISGFKLAGAGKELKGLQGLEGEAFKTSTLKIDHSTQVAQTVNAVASGASQGIQSGAGIAVAGLEYDAKAQEALSQLIAKTADSLAKNEGSTRQIIEKFVNDLIALLKNFSASNVR